MTTPAVEIRHIDLIDQLADDLRGVAGCLHALADANGPFVEEAEHLLSEVVESKAAALRGLSQELQGDPARLTTLTYPTSEARA